MADFIHCNSCNTIPDQNAMRKFCMATCGHLLCSRCRERGPGDQCCVCKKKCSLVEIGKLDASMQHVFLDPVSLAKKHQKQLAEALHFQKAHRTRYWQHLQQQSKRARKLQECATNEAKKRQHLERENEDLKQQVAQLKRQLIHSSTSQEPCMTPGPLDRYRSNNFKNNTMTVSSARTTLSMESGNSLPVGAEASTFLNQSANFHSTLPITPYLDESMSSPKMNFSGLENINMSRESMNTVVHGGGNAFDPMWPGNMSAMTLGMGSTPQVRNSGAFMNNVAAAFRRNV